MTTGGRKTKAKMGTAVAAGLLVTSAVVILGSALVARPQNAVHTISGQTCFYRGGLPDAHCTPGATDLGVTQDNIHQTICVAGYTARVRPHASYTNGLKLQQMRAYGVAAAPLSDYEEDHLISLELGGAPENPDNLWPEPWAGDWGAHTKDRLENKLRAEVCAERVTLVDAQQMVATDWVSAYQTYYGGQ